MPGFTLPMPNISDLYHPTCKKVLPTDWCQPLAKPDRDHYIYQFGFLSEPLEIPDVTGFFGSLAPQPYYYPASTNILHEETAKTISKPVKKFVHTALDKIKQAVDMWKLQAGLKDLKVMSVSAIGPPGCLDGPEMKGLAPFKSWKGKEDNEKAYIKAVVEGFSGQWKKWQDKVMVPGLPWYPAFAAFPGPSAPPMPNIPMPLIALPSAMMAEMTQPKLKDAMIAALDKKVKDQDSDKQHVAIFDTIAVSVGLAFLAWLPMQQVMLVMGKGPIPTFAPPYVPVGPVVGGDNIKGMHLMT